MNRPLLAIVFAAGAAACSSSSSSPDVAAPDAAISNDASPSSDASAVDAAGATTTIAQARMGNVTSSITVNAIVTGLHGSPNDYSQWYIEDPAGGPMSGVAVYCDPDLPSCPTIRAPNLYDFIQITGSLSTYKGALQFVPTAQKVLMSNATPPPVAMVTPTDLAPSGNSPYRGVVVKLAQTLTVDDVTPMALYDTECDTGTSDAGADAGPPLCTNCEPPTYSGFQANDGMGHEVYVEAFFFYTDHLQSSPECLSSSGAIPVRVGETFSSMTGILDFDPYASAQAFSPLSDADYTTP